MATAEQLKRTKEGFMVKLWPVYGPLGKREGQKAIETGHWWAEVIGDYEVPALFAAASWWLHNDQTGYWPKTPAVIKDWLVAQGYKPIPARALAAPPTDPLAAMRPLASLFYHENVVRNPINPETDFELHMAWLFNRKLAFEIIARRYELAHPEAFAILGLKAGERPNWADVMALGVTNGAISTETMKAEVLNQQRLIEERRATMPRITGGLAAHIPKPAQG